MGRTPGSDDIELPVPIQIAHRDILTGHAIFIQPLRGPFTGIVLTEQLHAKLLSGVRLAPTDHDLIVPLL